MKKLLAHISLFLIPILVAWILAEIFYRTVPNTYTFKNEQISTENNDVNMLVFGDSHSFYGINPEWLSIKTFNLANISQTIYFDQLLFEKHVKHLPELKYIILPIEYTTLSQVDNTQEDFWRKYFYSAQMDLEVPLVDWYNPKKYSLALSRRFDKTWQTCNEYHNKGTLIGCDVNGWGNTYLATVDSLELKTIAKNISRKHEDGSMDFRLNVERIQEIIDLCKGRNIEVILVNMPVTTEYLKLLNPEKLKKIEATCDSLVKENPNVIRINFLRDSRFNLSDFQDADHLNVQGAKKCSLFIDAYLKQN